MSLSCRTESPHPNFHACERQSARASHTRLLTNAGVSSPDGESIAYDIRSDEFDGPRIEAVNVRTAKSKPCTESKEWCFFAAW